MSDELEYGYILVSVKTAGGALPVTNAVVTVKDENDNILYVEFTDSSGNTQVMKVPAPAKSNSISPDTGLPPYFNYNIDTDKEGYVSVRNTNVPVYPGITSIQPVEMLPLPEGLRIPLVTFSESVPPEL